MTRARRRAARGRHAAGLDDDAVDARLQRRRRRRPRADLRAHGATATCWPRRSSSACSARTRRSPTASPAPTCSAPRYEPPFAVHRRRGVRRRRATPSCPATSSPPRTAPASSTPRSRSARTTSGSAPSRASTSINPVRPDGTYDERIGPYAGPLGQGRRRRPDRGPALARPAAARRAPPARLPALLALRHAAALLRQAVLVHPHVAAARPAAGRQRDRRLAPRAHQARAASGKLAGEQRRLGALARALLGHAAAGLALRERRTPSASARSPSSRSSVGRELDDPHRPYVDDVEFPCAELRRADAPRARGDRRLVRLGLRCRSPSTTRRSRTRTSSSSSFPADYICEAIDQTRGWFYSLLAISTLLFDRSPYETVLCLGHIADPEGKKMSKSLGNIVAPWEVHRPPRRRRVPLVLPDLQAAVGRLPVLDRRRSASRVRQFLLQLWNTYGFYVLYANVNDVDASARAGRRPTSTAGRCRASHATVDDRDASGSTPTTPRAPATRSRRSSTSSRTGTCAARGGASGTATRPRSATLRTCLVTVSKLLAPFCPFIADEIYDNLDGAEPSVHLSDLPEAGARDAALEVAMGVVRETVAPRARRARRSPSSRCASRCAPPWSSPPARERAAIERLADVVLRGAQRQGAALRRRRPTSSAPTRSSRTTARSARASASRCRRSRPRSRRSTRRTCRARCATAAASGSASTATTTSSAPTTCCSRCSRSTATSSSARARTRWRSSSSSTTSCAARGSRARSCTRSRTRARRAGLRGRGPDRAARSAATRSCSPPPARTRTYIAGETLAVDGRASTAHDGGDRRAPIEGRALAISVARVAR